MKRFFSQMIQILKRPFFIISLLFYFIIIIGLKVVFSLGIFINIFTLLFIPATAAIIYTIWNIFYNENISDEMFDNEIRQKYYNMILNNDKKNIESLMKSREEIQNLIEKAHINPSKQSLIYRLSALNFNDLIQKYANNSIKIKFIDDFLVKKGSSLKSVGDKLVNLKSAKQRFEKLNEEIFNSFESVQAQAVLILADDVSADMYSKDTIDDVMSKIESIETSNNEINKFYVSIHKGGEYE